MFESAPVSVPVEPIVARSVLDDVEAFLRRYVVFASDAQAVACTLFVAHTYVTEAAEVTPYLAVTSAEKQSGKSRLLEVLESLVRDPWKVISPSAAVLYRVIDERRPTLLLDEVDTIFSQRGNYEDIRAVLNAGFRRGSPIPRWDAEKRTVEMFDPFCAKVLAGIGDFPDTVQDRSIPIRLKRKTDAERVERFRRTQADQAAPIRERLEAWAEATLPTLGLPEVALPDELSDRQQDAWEPLFAIADTVGYEWPDRARTAAVELAKARVDGQISWGHQLLTDLHILFTERGHRHLSSQECIEWLNKLEDAPWPGWNKGLGLNSYRLNKLLEPYEIHTRDVRIATRPNPVKGFHSTDLQEAFQRWLSPADEAAHADTATSRQPAPPSVPGRRDSGETSF